MNNLKHFEFNNEKVRVMTDENNNPWFNGKDLCDCLGYVKSRDAIAQHVDGDDAVKYGVVSEDGITRKQYFVNESGMYALIFGSTRPEAKVFKKWVTSEVLPAIRKTGTYRLSGLILPNPMSWEKTFPQEFMRNAMKLYGYTYNPSDGTPQFIGKFINKYVYNCLDREMEKELKKARQVWKGERNSMSFLHQFLSEPGREGLKSHIITINALMANANNIDIFEESFSRVFTRRNQLEMYLR